MSAYTPVLRVLGILFIILGIAAIIGGQFSHSYVGAQLAEQKIKMPAVEALETDEQKNALAHYADQMMTTGPQAEAFANHYINVHMNDMADGKRFQEISGQFIAMSKDPSANQEEVAKLGELRQTLFMGESLRGMLLTAYAWWMVGSVALYGGIALLISGLAAVGVTFIRSKKATA